MNVYLSFVTMGLYCVLESLEGFPKYWGFAVWCLRVWDFKLWLPLLFKILFRVESLGLRGVAARVSRSSIFAEFVQQGF